MLFFRPFSGPIGDGFGIRGGRRHDGIDFPVPPAARAWARPAAATVEFAGWNSGGYGNLVIVQHRLGYQTWYAHLSRITTSPGEVGHGRHPARLRRAPPATPPGPTCTSRCA